MGKGNWIQLTSGGGYDFDEKRIFGNFDLETDVVQSLCCPRFVNHTSMPYSVAQHSVAVARTVLDMTGSRDAAAAGLLHDLHEAVIGDISTPVAVYLDYERVKELKHDVQVAMYTRLGIPYELLPERAYKPNIDNADQAALHVERRALMVPEPRAWSSPVPTPAWMQAMHRRFNEVLEMDPESVFLHDWSQFVEPAVVDAHN